MFKSTLFTLTTLLATTLALPAPSPQNARVPSVAVPSVPFGPVSITLIDAVGNEWPVEVPSDQSFVYTGVIESISHVRINNQGITPCTFYGVDGLELVQMPGEAKFLDVGPPQTIVGGHCGPCSL